MEYTAIKVEGMNHWLWFKVENVNEEMGQFKGTKGWGKDGNLTDIDIDSSLIVGRQYSNVPQYR